MDREFAEILLRETVLQHGRTRPIRARLLTRFLEAGNEIAHVLPVNVRTWRALLAEVFDSEFCRSFSARLIQECIEHDEFKHVSMDATLRCAMRIRGQESYRAPAAVRNEAPIGDADALRRVLTIRGRSGAILCMTPIKSEAGADISSWMLKNLSAEV